MSGHAATCYLNSIDGNIKFSARSSDAPLAGRHRRSFADYASFSSESPDDESTWPHCILGLLSFSLSSVSRGKFIIHRRRDPSTSYTQYARYSQRSQTCDSHKRPHPFSRTIRKASRTGSKRSYLTFCPKRPSTASRSLLTSLRLRQSDACFRCLSGYFVSNRPGYFASNTSYDAKWSVVQGRAIPIRKRS